MEKVKIQLKYPDVAVDEFGNLGSWTMVYNQGFEVTVAGRTYFGFSDYDVQGATIVSYCDRTRKSSGWSHDVTVRNWACFHGKKVDRLQPKLHFKSGLVQTQSVGQVYTQLQADVDDINHKQSSWTAQTYPHLMQLNLKEIFRMKGGENSILHTKPEKKKALLRSSEDSVKSYLPSSWDWRNVGGVNYVSDVRNQGRCGSCYAFSSLGMLESRVKILTNNTRNYVFSTQDIVSCSLLSQGCEGGFPYLVAGRYSKDYGVVEESCNPYVGEDGACSTKHCLR